MHVSELSVSNEINKCIRRRNSWPESARDHTTRRSHTNQQASDCDVSLVAAEDQRVHHNEKTIATATPNNQARQRKLYSMSPFFIRNAVQTPFTDSWSDIDSAKQPPFVCLFHGSPFLCHHHGRQQFRSPVTIDSQALTNFRSIFLCFFIFSFASFVYVSIRDYDIRIFGLTGFDFGRKVVTTMSMTSMTQLTLLPGIKLFFQFSLNKILLQSTRIKYSNFEVIQYSTTSTQVPTRITVITHRVVCCSVVVPYTFIVQQIQYSVVLYSGTM